MKNLWVAGVFLALGLLLIGCTTKDCEYYPLEDYEIVEQQYNRIDKNISSWVRIGYKCPSCKIPILFEDGVNETEHACGYTSFIITIVVTNFDVHGGESMEPHIAIYKTNED